MDVLIGIIGGGIVGLIITHLYYRKSQKNAIDENEKQLLEIKEDNDKKLQVMKNEFKTLNQQVSNIDVNKLPEKEKKEIITIKSELNTWISDLNNDLGKVESRMNQKISKKSEEEYIVFDSLRKYITFSLNFIDDIVVSLNETNNNCTWNKLELPANLFNQNIIEPVMFNNKALVMIEFGGKKSLIMRLHKPRKNELYVFPFVTIMFRFKEDNMRCDFIFENEFDFMESKYNIDNESYYSMFEKNIKEVFEYLIVERKNKG